MREEQGEHALRAQVLRGRLKGHRNDLIIAIYCLKYLNSAIGSRYDFSFANYSLWRESYYLLHLGTGFINQTKRRGFDLCTLMSGRVETVVTELNYGFGFFFCRSTNPRYFRAFPCYVRYNPFNLCPSPLLSSMDLTMNDL